MSKLLLEHYFNHPMHKGLNLKLLSENGKAELSMTVHKDICNLVGILHGSYYFKLMDDACFFAALSIEQHQFVATANFNIHYFKPASSGVIIAKAEVINHYSSKYVCECTIYDEENKKLGYGSGLFVAPKKNYTFARH